MKTKLFSLGIGEAATLCFSDTCGRTAKRRDDFISDHAWNTMKFKAFIRRSLSTSQRASRILLIRCVFGRWRIVSENDRYDTSHCHSVFVQADSQYLANDLCVAVHRRWFDISVLRVVYLIRRDKVEAVNHLARDAQIDAGKGNSKGLFCSVRSLSSRRKAKMQAVKLEDGAIAYDPLQCAERWQHFFSGLLGGNVKSFNELFKRAQCMNADAFHVLQTVGAHPLLLPSWSKLCTIFYSTSKDEAHGDDGLAAELYTMCPVL